MKKDAKWIILILGITYILLFKLFNNPRFYGHDTIFHAGSIIYMSQNISLKYLFGKNIIKLKYNPFGYGTWLFYPKLPHILGAYMYIMCKNVYLSMNIVYFITTFLSGISIFYLSKKLFKRQHIAFLSSVIYLTYSYHLCDIYVRDAYAENFMFMVIPLIFLGLFELKDNNNKKFYMFFILGYVIGMYSHLISMLFCTIFVALFLIFYRKIFFKRDKIKKLLVSTIIVTCLTLPFLTTIIEHKLLGNYIVFTDEAFSSKGGAILNTCAMSRYIIHNKFATHDNIIIYLNYTTIILMIMTTIVFFFKKNRNKFKEKRKLLLFSSLICIAFINSQWLWAKLPEVLSTIQFPWRIMTFFCAVISLYAPLVFIIKFKYIDKKVIYIIIICLNILEGYYNTFYIGRTEYTFKEIVNSRAVMGWQTEYLPESVLTYDYEIGYNDYISGDNYKITSKKNISIEIINDQFPNMTFKIDNIKEPLSIEIPRTYYLGYKLKDNKNKTYKLKESKKGLIKTNIKNNGTYTLKYVGTIYEQISKLIRKVCILSIIIYEVKKHEKNSCTNSMLQRRKNNRKSN